jgi:hypothetical protein
MGKNTLFFICVASADTATDAGPSSSGAVYKDQPDSATTNPPHPQKIL